MIEYLIISGGDITFFSILGLINELKKNNQYNFDNLKEIYSVSAGSMISLLLSLKLDFQIILNYFKERPWHKLINITSEHMLNIYNEKGLFDTQIIFKMFEPLFKLCNLDINITLKELYEYSNIKLNIYCTRVYDMEIVCFNHVNNPDIKVIEAIYMSSTIPILFKPIKYKNNYYLDGGYNCNYPIQYCLKEHNELNKIFGIEAVYSDYPSLILDDENILSFYSKIFYKFILMNRKKQEYVSDELKDYKRIVVMKKTLNTTLFFKLLNEESVREKWIEVGVKAYNTFLENESKE